VNAFLWVAGDLVKLAGACVTVWQSFFIQRQRPLLPWLHFVFQRCSKRFPCRCVLYYMFTSLLGEVRSIVMSMSVCLC